MKKEWKTDQGVWELVAWREGIVDDMVWKEQSIDICVRDNDFIIDGEIFLISFGTVSSVVTMDMVN